MRFEDGVYAWSGRFVCDADGSSMAYAPSGSGLLGLDYLDNAGHGKRFHCQVCGKVDEVVYAKHVSREIVHPEYHADTPLLRAEMADWYGLATVQGVPVIQNHDDPHPGYYVSTTALVNHNFRTTDPRRYVDSTKIPYIAVPLEMRHDGVLLGDVAMVLYGSKRCGAVVADVCPKGHYGEGSIALAKILGIPDSAKHGGVDSGVSFAVFKQSSHGWPREPLDISTQALALFKQWGDLPRLTRVLGV